MARDDAANQEQARPSADERPLTPRETLERLGSQGPRSARFRDEREIARGGMGAILRAWDPELRRELALKVLLTSGASEGPTDSQRPATEADERLLSRFLDEAQITGQLDHPGIVPVHELGIDDAGRLYFTMRLVRGQDLERVFRALAAGDPTWSRTRVLQILLKVCESMSYAHSKGIVHRDLKPANVMVGRFGEVYVMDWGLARVLEREDRIDIRLRSAPGNPASMIHTDRDKVRRENSSSPLVTMDGDVVGTPAYMAPEQARGELHLVDRRADVYSIGAMLYHVLTGHAPYQDTEAKDNLATWQAVKNGPPTPIESSGSDAPPELVAICEKAMQRDLLHRYKDTRELEADLRSFLEGRVVGAYEAGPVAEARKWILRNKALAATAAAAVVLSLGGLSTAAVVQAGANRELGNKNAKLATASSELERARDDALASAEEAREQRAEMARLAEQMELRAQEATRERDASERLVGFLADLFGSSAPETSRGEDLRVRELLERGAEDLNRLEDEPLLAARMREAMGKAYLGLGLFDSADPLLQEALDDRVALLGDEHVDALAARGDLGLLRYYQARYDEAREHLTAALDGRILALGPEAPEVQESRRKLALVANKEGRFDEARELLETALAVQEADTATDRAELLRTVNSLGGILFRTGETRDARALLEQAFDGRLELLGDDHPETLASQNDLAFLLATSGETRAARDLYERCLERQLEVHGPRHPFTLTVQNNLAALLSQIGEAGTARALYEEALETAKAELGQGHPTTLGILNGLAAVELQLGDVEDAASHFEEVLIGLLIAFEPDHANVRTLRDNLVVVYRELERPRDALRHAEALLRATPEGDPERGRLQDLVTGLRAQIDP